MTTSRTSAARTLGRSLFGAADRQALVEALRRLWNAVKERFLGEPPAPAPVPVPVRVRSR